MCSSDLQHVGIRAFRRYLSISVLPVPRMARVPPLIDSYPEGAVDTCTGLDVRGGVHLTRDTDTAYEMSTAAPPTDIQKPPLVPVSFVRASRLGSHESDLDGYRNSSPERDKVLGGLKGHLNPHGKHPLRGRLGLEGLHPVQRQLLTVRGVCPA